VGAVAALTVESSLPGPPQLNNIAAEANSAVLLMTLLMRVLTSAPTQPLRNFCAAPIEQLRLVAICITC
jgi:hypothetical protein